MAECNETHPFQVSIWRAGNQDPRSLFECGYWMEIARCLSEVRAQELVRCLALRHSGVQVARLVSDSQGARFVGCQFYPDVARTWGSSPR